MNKILLITFLLSFPFISCKKDEIQLPAKKVYIIATYLYLLDDYANISDSDSYLRYRPVGVAEVSQNMKAKIIRNEGDNPFRIDDNKYFSADIHLLDTTKQSLIKLLEECQQDTIFEAKKDLAEVDGLDYIIVIEKENGEHIFIYPERYANPPQYVNDVFDILFDLEKENMKNFTHLEYEEAEKILEEKGRVIPNTFGRAFFPPPARVDL